MSQQRIATDYLRDMLEYMTDAEQFVVGIDYQEFLADKKTHRAVIHCIAITGEAASKIPLSIREKYPDVSWRDVINMRNP